MDISTKSRAGVLTKLLILLSMGLFAVGCADIGGSQLSLLTSSQVLDPLEVPPGMSPLPEAEQFQLPGELDPSSIKLEDIPPEQFRNYASWVAFEKYQQFRKEDQGVGKGADEFRLAVQRGEGNFKVTTRLTGSNTMRLRVVDSIDSVWTRLRPVLEDMGIIINNAREEKRIYHLSNVPIKELPKLTQRLGFKEYAGKIDELHLITSSATETEIIAKTDLNVEVRKSASKDFFTRLRYYLLTNYKRDERGTQLASLAEVKKRFARDENGSQFIILSENFESAWVRIGRTLEASGMSIDDLNRSQGLYLVSYSTAKKKKKRKFRLAFWRKQENEISQEQFQVLVSSSGEQTLIRVKPSASEQEDANSAGKLLVIIYERLLT